ncbi:heavy metal-associated isoprenylated plant protein 2-like [Ziziphus jujuba]|uniref:Heavy metal-associated isoprenylated plant protein 2-like n=1 Tax=Ziziphus jujuba TaxID=326968 RepID=A0ABM4AAK0_ZIZJJ|nr:heavy metal-associated isoprenylated plant protein 2-like [Ziziphus jujuba]
MKKTVIQVNIKCQKCKTDVLKATTKLSGIQEVSVDGEKELLSVVGDVDPVLVVKNLRKIGKVAKIISVGPPKSEKPKQSPKKPCNLPPCCNDCQLVAVGFSQDYNGGCHIL